MAKRPSSVVLDSNFNFLGNFSETPKCETEVPLSELERQHVDIDLRDPVPPKGSKSSVEDLKSKGYVGVWTRTISENMRRPRSVA